VSGFSIASRATPHRYQCTCEKWSIGLPNWKATGRHSIPTARTNHQPGSVRSSGRGFGDSLKGTAIRVRATASIEEIWCEEMRGCSCRVEARQKVRYAPMATNFRIIAKWGHTRNSCAATNSATFMALACRGGGAAHRIKSRHIYAMRGLANNEQEIDGAAASVVQNSVEECPGQQSLQPPAARTEVRPRPEQPPAQVPAIATTAGPAPRKAATPSQYL